MLGKKLEYLENLCGIINDRIDKGYNTKAIMKALSPSYREVMVVKYMTSLNVSFSNIIHSLMKKKCRNGSSVNYSG